MQNFKEELANLVEKFNTFYTDDKTSLKSLSLKKGSEVICGHCSALNSHNHTYFSVMDGISSPENMVDMSAMRGWGGIGISDHGTMGGVLRAGKAGKKWHSIKLPVKSGYFKNFSILNHNSNIKQYINLNFRELDLTSSDGKKYLSGSSIITYSPDFIEFYGEQVIKDLLLKTNLMTFEQITLSEDEWIDIRNEFSNEQYKFLHDKNNVKGLVRIFQNPTLDKKSNNLIEKLIDLINDGYILCDDNFIPLSIPDIFLLDILKNRKNMLVVHDLNNPKKWRKLDAKIKTSKPDKIQSFADNWDIFEESIVGGEFKTISGCELYVSWENQKDKRYHHITVYATGQKGHRAIVLLTSIGSIPSRRYKGASGFIRPRIFVEDLAKAIEEAEGELIVTTGCPISITSEALKNGQINEARRFFEWAIENIPRSNFFAELHLCDVSLDWNDKFNLADGKYYSSLFNTPISRFRYSSESTAIEYSELFLSELRLFSTGASIKGKKLNSKNINPLEIVQEEMFDSSSKQGMEFIKKYQNSGIIRPLFELGIKDDIYDLFTKEEVEKLSIINNEILDNAYQLLKIGTDLKTNDYEDYQGSCEASEKPKYDIKTVYGRDLVKIQGGRYLQILDEDTLSLLSKALEVFELIEKNNDSNKKTYLYSANYLARVIIYVITKIATEENLLHISPIKVLTSFLSAPFNYQLGNRDEDEVLSEIATDRLFCLDLIQSFEIDESVMFSLTRSLHNLLKGKRFIDKAVLNPSAGLEDGLEKEWNLHPDGNWMERVNRELVKLAKEYGVPLLLATDSHMTDKSLKFVQDALMKRGKRRAWHMSVPYAIPRSDILGLVSDLGDQWYEDGMEHIKKRENTVFSMISKDIFSLEDLLESIGSGSIILDKAKSCGSFKWKTAVPKIKYESHPLYTKAKSILDSGELAEFLSIGTEISTGANKIKFTQNSLNISTALIVIIFLEAIEKDTIKAANEYYERILSELYLMQEVPNEQLCDFFLILQFLIERWRKRGISVGPGRGSSGGMLTAKISGITYGDPIVKGFLEARWMNRGRKIKGAHADIDIDVSDRQLAGYELALVAKDALEESIKEKPLSNLESILFKELFFSSVPVSHEEIGGYLIEKADAKKDIKSAFLGNLQAATKTNATKIDEQEKEEVLFDDLKNIEVSDESLTVVGTPLIRVGTYQSLKAKAAVKEAIRIADKTSFDLLPSFAEPSTEWLSRNKEKFWVYENNQRRPMTDEEKNRLYEDEFFSHMNIKERISRRRVRLGDRITKAMAAGSGLARLYQSELDYFMGSVYGEVPNYWDASANPPVGSDEAKIYFKENPHVEELVIDMLNIYKAPGVHAGGFCIGREVFERVPVRSDKYGYVSQFEMKDIENVGILKFDILGLKTLSQISETLKFIVNEEDYQNISWWMPYDIYNRIKNGESTDIAWHYMPKSTKESLETLCSNRMMTFQIDTKVFGKELDKLSLNKNSILKILSKEGDLNSNSNDKLTDILNAFLALFRPGPMKSSSHIKYIERLLGKPWKHEVIDNWLLPFIQDTFGLIVYQEQVMKIYSNAAIVLDKNYNPILDKDGKFITASEEETDEVRRAMGKKDMASLNKLDAKGKFMRGLKIQGVSEDKASKIWDEIEPFAEYGFNCIDKSSLILTDHGYIEVCKINLSEHKIASLDENSGILFENPTFVGKTGEKEVFEVLLEDNTVIRATLDHPFLFMGNWVKLERLIEFGFFEVINQFNNSKVIKVKSVKYLGVKDVYDITMPTNHNFIMHGGVVAHNCPHSYHYGIITAVTLFLKAHYQKYFFRVTMGLADASDASRFLSEIQRFVKAPDILYSDEVFWEINDGYYYPGLSAVEGLKTKDIEKILETRNKINNSNLELNALEFFRNFGKITPSLATLLAKSGSLRSLGSQETIANSYIEALKTINGFSNDDIINISNEQESNEKVKIENADDYDSINIKSVGKKSKPKTKNKAFKLGKKEEEIYEIFLKLGPKYADNSSNEDNIGKVLTIESAMDIVTSNRTKGAGIRHLSAAVEYEEKLNKVSNKPPLVMVKSLLNMAINDEILLEPNQKYRIIAIPRSISTSKSYDGKPTEPKVNFTSEGSDISLKFSKKYQTEKLEADLLMLKDGKMSVPFIIEVYAGRFTNDRKEVINYYKIESIEKIITN